MISPGREGRNFSIWRIFAAISGAKLKWLVLGVPARDFYNSGLVGTAAISVTQIKLVCGSAGDFRCSAGCFVGQPAQKSSFLQKCAESRRKCAEHLIFRISKPRAFRLWKFYWKCSSELWKRVAWVFACFSCFSGAEIPVAGPAKTHQKSCSTKITRFQSCDELFQ